MSVIPTNSATSLTSSEDARENRLSKSCIAKIDESISLSGYVNNMTVVGVSKSEYSDDRYQSLFGGSPAEAIHFHLVIESSSATTLRFVVDLEYDVECFDHNILTAN
jgi:hypothetical protein